MTLTMLVVLLLLFNPLPSTLILSTCKELKSSWLFFFQMKPFTWNTRKSTTAKGHASRCLIRPLRATVYTGEALIDNWRFAVHVDLLNGAQMLPVFRVDSNLPQNHFNRKLTFKELDDFVAMHRKRNTMPVFVTLEANGAKSKINGNANDGDELQSLLPARIAEYFRDPYGMSPLLRPSGFYRFQCHIDICCRV
jgi:hypothetical protein